MRILTIGSGIAGLSAAIAMRKVGCEVAAYELAAKLREVGARISLWANALRGHEAIGAGDVVKGASVTMTRSEMRAKNGFKVQLSYPVAVYEKVLGIAPVIAMIHRAELVGELATLLPAGVARCGFECEVVTQDANGVTVRFRNGPTDTADLVVGADGLNSAVGASRFGPRP